MCLMLEALFGNKTAERVLLYLANYKSGYATKISRTFKISLNMVQKQMDRLEQGGILVSKLEGRTRLYQLNPRFFLYKKLMELLNVALDFVPEKEKNACYSQRTRPRRKGKPL